MDAKQALIDYKGVFLDQGCLFLSTTGKLLTGYVNCEVIYPHYDVTRDLVNQLINPFLERIDGFVSPATGDIVLLEYTTFMANRLGYPTKAVWADKEGDNYRIARNGFPEAIAGKRVLILNDRISQGGTTTKVIAEARRNGAEVMGVATLADVTSVSAESLGVPELHALCTIDVQAFAYGDLPEELRGLPLCVDEPLGHGFEFEAKMGFPWHGETVSLLAA